MGERFRVDVVDADEGCPRLCKRMFKRLSHKGIPLGDIYNALGTTTDIRVIVPTADEIPLLQQLVELNPEDDTADPFPDSWTTTLAFEEKIFWKDLYEKDLATRAEVEGNGEEDGDEGSDEDDDAALKSVDKKIKVMKKKMEKRFKVLENKLQKKHDKKFRELKSEMKTLVRQLLDAESRKSGTGKSRKSTMEKGECSRRTLIDEDEEDEEYGVEEESEKESEEESEEESEVESEEE